MEERLNLKTKQMEKKITSGTKEWADHNVNSPKDY